MNLSGPFIRRPVMTTLVMFAILFFGIVSYMKIPVSALPSISYPTITVKVEYPGATPETMANFVAAPLETELLMAEGMRVLTSTNAYSQTTIVCEFYLNIDINTAIQEVQEAINRAQGSLPRDLPQNPEYYKTNPTDSPIIFICLNSSYISKTKLFEYGSSMLGRQLGTIEGVAEIISYGNEFAVRVDVDPQELSSRNISLKEVAEALNNANPDLPTGKLYGPTQSMVVSSQGQIKKAESYNSVIIKTVDGNPVRISDIGNAYSGIKSNKITMNWWAEEEVKGFCVLAVKKMDGFNTVKVSEEIMALVEEFKKQIPASIDVFIPYKQSYWIHEAVDDVRNTLLIAFLLVVIVIFIYLGKIKNTVIPIITLPITLSGTFLCMYLLGYSENILSMSALTLSIGFLVDDAIVVLENIVRWAQKGHSPYKASLNGSEQISTTIFSISLCLAIVFVPLIFMGGLIGRIFHEFSMVIFIAILFSGFISLTLTPMLCSRFISSYEEKKASYLERFGNRLNESLLTLYRPLLKWTLKHSLKVFGVGIVIILVTGVLFIFLPRSFLPHHDLGVVQCFGIASQGTSPKKMLELVNPVLQELDKSPYVDSIGQINSFPNDNEALFFLNLIARDKRPGILELIKEFQKTVGKYDDLMIVMKPFPLINLQVGSSAAGRANYQYVLRGLESSELYASAEKLMSAMKASGLFAQVSSDMQNTSPTVDIQMLRDEAYLYGGLTPRDIEEGFKYAYGEVYTSRINTALAQYYVVMQVQPKYNQFSNQFGLVYLQNSAQEAVSLDSVTQAKIKAAPLTVNHLDGVTAVIISFDMEKGVALSKGVEKLSILKNEILPESVTANLIGNTAAFEKAFNQLWWLLIVALLCIYLVLGILYEDFLLPLAALSAIPTGALGALLTLLIFNETLSLYAFIGIVMLLGIVMKNGILIVEFAVELMQKEGASSREAAFKACMIRFRPILMTTLAAIMGAIPIAIGFGGTIAQGREPLGMVIVGGLAFSQFTTLFITPVSFILIERLDRFIKSKTTIFTNKEIETEE